MEYKIELEEIHVNNARHIIKYSEVGQKTFDEILDYNFDLKG
jgi:hypothetical protein